MEQVKLTETIHKREIGEPGVSILAEAALRDGCPVVSITRAGQRLCKLVGYNEPPTGEPWRRDYGKKIWQAGFLIQEALLTPWNTIVVVDRGEEERDRYQVDNYSSVGSGLPEFL